MTFSGKLVTKSLHELWLHSLPGIPLFLLLLLIWKSYWFWHSYFVTSCLTGLLFILLLGLGDQKTKWASAPIPCESTVGPTSCKGMDSFTSHGPLGMPQKCHKATVYMFLQRYVKRTPYSWLLYLPSPTECVSIKIYQKATPPDS
jgi:hypothetical protein